MNCISVAEGQRARVGDHNLFSATAKKKTPTLSTFSRIMYTFHLNGVYLQFSMFWGKVVTLCSRKMECIWLLIIFELKSYHQICRWAFRTSQHTHKHTQIRRNYQLNKRKPNRMGLKESSRIRQREVKTKPQKNTTPTNENTRQSQQTHRITKEEKAKPSIYYWNDRVKSELFEVNFFFIVLSNWCMYEVIALALQKN